MDKLKISSLSNDSVGPYSNNDDHDGSDHAQMTSTFLIKNGTKEYQDNNKKLIDTNITA